ncbi:TPA: helix-turn-helix transcriptional regulator [Citrobacter freundii]|uniref:helix-turn-helix transcriptional regulator n=1 Tax=Enterobacteriaceae TaxID=543 RepID=UPI000669A578|nr:MULTISPECIES: AlpA family phage regulatory protein [Enterobacteriaceae]MDT7354491.1 AlpA family phage regulatory protein [Citrobacter freundii]MDT9378699.1 AlpA family phage regulatory protein [Citrobacter freundii]MDT9877381.1 AlpA family phage regulatory protein [Enterobacter cloacae]MDX7510889.1 AlpA family phage regulatory protein [Citrobacter freundii]MEB0829606.1 AlpA family phage regulatory protein [Citrobacter freundii]
MHQHHSSKTRMSELASSISRHLHSVDSVSQHKESQTEEKSVLTDLEGEKCSAHKAKGPNTEGDKQSQNRVISPEEDQLIDMKYITAHSGLSDKYFYSIIRRGTFPRPIKLGRSSRWKKSEFDKWIEERVAAR